MKFVTTTRGARSTSTSSIRSTEELLMARLTGDAMTEAAQEELSQIPLIRWLVATTKYSPQHS